MKIKFFCPRWGANDNWDSFCQRVKGAGYDGVEVNISNNQQERQEMRAALQKNNLDLIIQALPLSSNPEEHKREFEKMLRDFAALNPLFINCQTGKDFFFFEDNQQIILVADKVAKEIGIRIIHETHRGKFSYAAQVLKPYLEKMPDLRITLDISHWCNVSESLLEDQQEAVDAAISRTDHIHSRVGHAEGPQVNDPRAPEWEKEVQAHLAWWDKIVQQHRRINTSVLTITPEFGPPAYLPTLPYTRQPVASQWDINVHILRLLNQRYGLS